MRQTQILTKDWQFCRDNTSWKIVQIPHDWAIQGPFSADNDRQVTRIVADGESQENTHYGRTGGLPHTGKGYYQKVFMLPESGAGKHFRFEFDGIMSHSEVVFNGQNVGGRPYGYSSFEVDVTEYVKIGHKNLLEVNVNNPPSSSRWYPGAGIYREARLVQLESEHFLYNGIQIVTEALDIEAQTASLRIDAETSCENIEISAKIKVGNKTFVSDGCRIDVSGFELWSAENPTLYKLEISLIKDGEIKDQLLFDHGFRSLVFDKTEGMMVNGNHTRLNGVCLHHDLGPLGAAFNKASMRHRLNLLKRIGCNAIRTVHNPPDPKLLDLCDELGFYVIDEAFDMWATGKTDNDYHVDYPEWHEKDLSDFVRRDRNHCCIIMWSIGNEILEQHSADGASFVHELQNIVHQLDDRPVTAGFDMPALAIKNGLPQAVDIPGWNYKPHLYKEFKDDLAGKLHYGSETASTVSTRGFYSFPVTEGSEFDDSKQCSSYDVQFPPWASTPDTEFKFQDECPWIMGEFVWTGFDYLGEPTPFKHDWPIHSSFFGIFDLAALPKDRVWLYAARWGREPVLHILPHWAWTGREGLGTPVHVYTNYPQVELFVNGKSYGIKSTCYSRVRFDDVIYQPGKVKAVAYDENGNIMDSSTSITAGTPAKIALSADRITLQADGNDLAFITVSILDENGILCPDFNEELKFDVSGTATFAAAANGNPHSLELFHLPHMHAFNGQCMVIIRSKEQIGASQLTVSSKRLPKAQIKISCKMS